MSSSLLLSVSVFDFFISVAASLFVHPCHDRDVSTGQSILTLIGHEDSVVALSVTREGLLVSGSWDKYAHSNTQTHHTTTA